MSAWDIISVVEIFIGGALCGAFVGIVWLWYQLATGKRTVRPLPPPPGPETETP